MSVLVIHGPKGCGVAANADALAAFFGIDTLLTDGFEAPQEFPARRAIVISHRSPAAIASWRARSIRNRRAAEAAIYIPAETALRMLQRNGKEPA